MPGIDLHVHTTYSDGTFSPPRAVEHALGLRLEALAITDHDSTEGIAEAVEAAAGTGMRVIPGVEFSTLYEGAGVHVLAYWPGLGAGEFQAELKRLREDRWTRGERMVRRLQELGYPILFDRVAEIAQGGNIGRPHVAQALVEAGVVRTLKEAFSDDLIGSGGRAYVEKHAIHPLEAIALMDRAGAASVLAHPVHWKAGRPVPTELIREMAEAGLDGIECAHPDHDRATESYYRALAENLGLVETGSSDCHGDRYDPVRMGSRSTDPVELARLEERRG